MRVAVLYSSGKDSNYALYLALNQGWDVECLVTLKPKDPESYMFHVPCVDLTALQAESMGIPLIKKEVSGVKEEEVAELEELLSGLDVDAIVSGAVASEYQKTRLETVAENLNIKSFAPLWHKDSKRLLADMIHAEFEIMIVGVSAYGLDEGWLGRILDKDCLNDLVALSEKHEIHLTGEGGEYETFVLDAPMFKKRIQLIEMKKKWEKQSGFVELKAKLVEKI